MIILLQRRKKNVKIFITSTTTKTDWKQSLKGNSGEKLAEDKAAMRGCRMKPRCFESHQKLLSSNLEGDGKNRVEKSINGDDNI